MATAAWLDSHPEIDRRAKARFPLELDVSFCSSGKPPRTQGLGSTINMSSTGLLIRAEDHNLLPGDLLKVSIEWPWMLDRVTPLRLVAIGSVVRASRETFALRVKHYQFRTAARRVRAAGA